MVVGVGGLYCSGKSTLAQILIDAGYREIDVDALGHQALLDCRDQVAERFGEAVVSGDGTIDRRALGDRVFGDAEARRRLEAILHPHMVHKAAQIVAGVGEGEPVVIHAALLFFMGLDRLCDCIIWVRAPLWMRVRRGLQRSHGNLARVFRIIWAQRKLGVQPRDDSVDIHIVENRGTPEQLRERLRRLNLPRI